MFLHRYLQSHAFETLNEAKLKTARITAFNDPFEFRFLTTGTITAETARDYVLSRLNNPDFLALAAEFIPGLATASDPCKVLNDNIPVIVARMVQNAEEIKRTPLRLREQMADRSIRVVCFSNPAEVSPLDEILLWSHYANKHEGFRIGFAFPDEIRSPFKISKVHYSARRYEVDFSKGLSNLNVGQALIDSVKVKSLAWQYEHEYRLLTHPGLCESRPLANSPQECFVPFERTWVKSVDFGVRCPKPEIERILSLLRSEYPKDVLSRRACVHESQYALEYTQV